MCQRPRCRRRRSGNAGKSMSSRVLSALPLSHLLGNGRYGVLLRANGAGYSHCEGQGLTRWRDDGLRDMHGLFAYLKREKRDLGDRDEPWLSLAARPAGDGSARYRTEFHPDRVVLRAQWSDLATSTTVFVSPEDNCELRRVELHNTSRREIRLTLAVAFEAHARAARRRRGPPGLFEPVPAGGLVGAGKCAVPVAQAAAGRRLGAARGALSRRLLTTLRRWSAPVPTAPAGWAGWAVRGHRPSLWSMMRR